MENTKQKTETEDTFKKNKEQYTYCTGVLCMMYVTTMSFFIY